GVQEASGKNSPAFRVTAAITGSAWRAAMEERAAAIVACTRSGATARAISRFRPPMPILAITPNPNTALQLKGSWGIDDVVVSNATDMTQLVEIALDRLRATGTVHSGDVVVVMAGSSNVGASITDTVRMVIVP
ncbi:MAG TPA: pyruvate kinase alpha/beta domain-containing protein, partial [Acidimicrobiales bacterium]|nr:pyruvate kinase alpha/beta domain-containing protein [Acidimicrobiales bacterium]HVB01533.1 pyruvate kinase alpha/beta domain-containing protein [Acidimicrobiales bacterium]